MWRTRDGRFAREVRGDAAGRHTQRPVAPPSSEQQPSVLPLLSISAKTVSSPPITYWEKWQPSTSQPLSRNQAPEDRENSVWQNMVFALNLRRNNINRSRYVNVFCEPLPPLGTAPEFMEVSWALGAAGGVGAQVVLSGAGNRARGWFVDLRISSMGSLRGGPSISSPELRYRWTAILENLRDALRKADGVMDLRIGLEKESDVDAMRSFFADAEAEKAGDRSMTGGDYWRPNYEDRRDDTRRQYSDLPVSAEPRAARQDAVSRSQDSRHNSPRPLASSTNTVLLAERSRPQTNPLLDPTVYDPFPGMPVAAPTSAPPSSPLPSSKSSIPPSRSPTPAETSQAMAALQLSDEIGPTNFDDSESHNNEYNDKMPDFDAMSSSSSSSNWSFLAKSNKMNQVDKPSSLSSSSSSSSSPSPSPSPPPQTPWRAPIVVKSESESSDVEILSVREKSNGTEGKRKKKRSAREEKEKEETGKTRKKKKKKRREVVVESSAEDESNEVAEDPADSEAQEEVEVDEEEAEAERRRKRRERRRKRRTIDLVNDEDVEIVSDGRSTKKKKKKKIQPKAASDSEAAASVLEPTEKKKKRKKGKNKANPPESESEEPPSRRKSSGSASESRKSLKRKHFSSDVPDEEDTEEVAAKRERLKKRITEINLQKHELRVEEEEIKAMLHRLDFDSRKQDSVGLYRAHCVCSACGKYGHRKNSSICELYPGRRWR